MRGVAACMGRHVARKRSQGAAAGAIVGLGESAIHRGAEAARTPVGGRSVAVPGAEGSAGRH